MKLVMTLLVRDEEDIIEDNIEYHLSRGVDFLIVTDNLSVDKTPRILEKYCRKGVVKIINEVSDDYSQSVWVTRMAKMAYLDYGADWVLNSDADEFWWTESEVSLKEALSSVPIEYPAVSIPRLEFLPREGVPGTSPLKSMIFRLVEAENLMGHPLQPKVCHRGFADIEIVQGNHAVRRGKTELEETNSSEVSIFHFPVRSYAQFANKIAKGGAALERNLNIGKGMGYTWRYLYKELKEGKLEEFYKRRMLLDDHLEAESKSGRIVQDDRLSKYLYELKNE